MLCDICQKKEGTVHTGSGSGSKFTDHFCTECFQQSGPLPGFQVVEGLEQVCHYCGQPCDFGRGKVSVQMPGAVAGCRECGADFDDFIQHHMGEPSSEQEFVRELDAFMKKRIAARDSHGI
jgi:protein-arginine kinase activator protein McsA